MTSRPKPGPAPPGIGVPDNPPRGRPAVIPGLPESESGFQGWVIDLAHTYGWLVYHARPSRVRDGRWATAMTGDPGFPDLVLARGGRVIFAELKTDRGRISDSQQQWLEYLQGDGDDQLRHPRARSHEVYVWRPVDRAWIQEVLK